MNNKKLIKKQYLKSINQQNARKWSTKRQTGGELSTLDQYQQMLNNQNNQLKKYSQQEELKQKRMEQLQQQRIQSTQSLGNQIGNIVGQVGGALSNKLEDTKFGKWVDKVNTNFNDWLSDDKEENDPVKAEDKLLKEKLKLPVTNSDEILGDDFLEKLTKQLTT